MWSAAMQASSVLTSHVLSKQQAAFSSMAAIASRHLSTLLASQHAVSSSSRVAVPAAAAGPPLLVSTASALTLVPSWRHGLSTTTGDLHVSVEPQAEQYEGVSVITLNRADARNAIGRQLLRELAEAINYLRQERTTRCVILRSSVPGVFCAGADLKERAMMTQQEAAEFVNCIRRTFSDLQALPIPTIAAIEGHALGGGAELALACDMRVVGPAASFAFPEAQLGIIPGAGGTQRLPRLIGVAKAKELIFSCRRVPAAEATELGLAEHAAEEGHVLDKALDLARQISRSAPLSLRMAKEAINQGINVDLMTGLKLEEACYAQLLPTKDRMEGLKAFAEKRAPSYTGE